MLLVNGDGTSLMLNIIDLVYQKNIRPPNMRHPVGQYSELHSLLCRAQTWHAKCEDEDVSPLPDKDRRVLRLNEAGNDFEIWGKVILGNETTEVRTLYVKIEDIIRKLIPNNILFV
jgi:hypothetical protein